MRHFKNKHLSLKQASKIFGYSSDYIGSLIRKRKIRGKKVYSTISWQVSKQAIIEYCEKRKRKVKSFNVSGSKHLSLKQAAKISGYSSDYIGFLIRKGKIKGRKIPIQISWLVSGEDIEKYQASKSQKLLNRKNQFSNFVFSLSRDKIFGTNWRLALTTFVIICFITGLAPIKFLQSSIAAVFFEEPQTVNLYNTLSYGSWQNSENVQGMPNVESTGDINSFSEANSAVYKTGTLVLMSEGFVPEGDLEIISPDPVEQPETIEQQPPEPELLEEPLLPEETLPEQEEIDQMETEESSQALDETEEVQEEQGEVIPEESSQETEQEGEQQIEEQPEEQLEEEPETQELEEQEETIQESDLTTQGEIEEQGEEQEQQNEPQPEQESPVQESQPNEDSVEDSVEPPTSFLERIKKVVLGSHEAGIKRLFNNFTVGAKEVPTSEDLNRSQLLSVKIKFSFAIGEKESDVSITEDNETESNNFVPEEPISFWNRVKKFFGDLLVKGTFTVKAEETVGEENIPSLENNDEVAETDYIADIPSDTDDNIIDDSPTIDTTDELEVSQEVSEEESQVDEIPQVEEIELPDEEQIEEQANEETQEEIIQNEETQEEIIQNEETQEEIIQEELIEEEVIEEEPVEQLLETQEELSQEVLPNLDTKIIVWWSLDGSNWQILDTISGDSLSNALNNGYFEYDATFLKSWDDIKNLKVQFEGVVGGESNTVAYLDSIWVEANYQKEELEEEDGFELTAIKKDWRADETPTFEIVSKEEKNIVENLIGQISSVFEEEPKVKAKLDNPQNQELELQEGEDFSAETHSPTKVTIFKPEDFRPGRYHLKITFEKNGKVFEFEQDFTWGVLAININKSIYLLGETAYLQMGALRDNGHTICDANLRLEITSSNGQVASPEVQKSGKCEPDNVTDVPDYFAYYQVNDSGVYDMKLINLDNGYEIEDSFEVRDYVPFDVERIGPTRIYPPAIYKMTLKIKTNQNFQGQVIETMPASFGITETSDKRQEIRSGEKLIIWDVNWKTGETYELKYQFDAPDISPYLYLLGPLQIGDFQEIRQWQIASDQLGMEQVIFGGHTSFLDPTDTLYNSLQGGSSWDILEADVYKIISTDGTIKSLRVKLDGVPGAGKHYDFTVMLNGNPTALTVEIADTATSNSDMVNEVVVTGGDTISIRCVPTGTPTAVRSFWTSVFEGDTANESLIMGGGNWLFDGVNTEYGQVMGGRTFLDVTENNHRQVVPTAGTIKNFYVKLSADPGTAPDAYRLTLRKGGVSQTLTVTITADDTTGSDLVNSFTVAAGDVLTMMIEPLNAPSVTPYSCWGMTFVADIDDESIILGGSTDDLSSSLTEYHHLSSAEMDGPNEWIATEAWRFQLGQVSTLKKLHVLLSAAPNAGNSYQFGVRVAGADSDVGVLIANLETTGASSGSAEVDVANDNYVNLQVVPTSNPDVVDAYWGLVGYTGPPIEREYTPKIATFAIAADATWTDYDLYTLQGVPKGAVAEIVVANKNTGFARVAGVKTDGSGLDRFIDIHEAEGDGVTTATMFVKSHETTGLIECYSEIQGDVEFYLLGYFSSDFDFTESITSLGQPGLTWTTKDLTASSVPDNAVVQILMGNETDNADYFAGVRANGSSLERGVTLDEAEADGWTTLSMVVRSDSGAVIDWKGGSVTDVTMWLLGWFSSNIDFTEGFTDYSPAADNTWESKIIAQAPADSVVAFAMVHQDSGLQQVTGLKEEGSVLARTITEHEAEGGSSTGFQACIQLDADKKCEVYLTDASEGQFAYTGYFREYVFTPKLHNWKWYENDGAEPTTQLADQNTKPTGIEQNDVLRLRVDVYETDGVAGTNQDLVVEYSDDESTWYALGIQDSTGSDWRWYNGQATAGNTITGYKLTCSDESGKYREAECADCVDVGANKHHEMDITIQNYDATGGTTYYFRMKLEGNVLPLEDPPNSYPQVKTLVEPGQSTSGNALDESYQRTTFYANGRFWIFYMDGSDYVYISSTDAATWSDPISVGACPIMGANCSAFFDDTYVHYARFDQDGSDDLFYRRGEPQSNGTISWSAVEQTVYSGSASDRYQDPMIAVDSGGYAWIGARKYIGNTPYVLKNANNNGTWSTDFSYLLFDAAYQWRVMVVPLTNLKVYVIYSVAEYQTSGKLYNSGWGSQEDFSNNIQYAWMMSATNEGDDIHYAYLQDVTYQIRYNKRVYSTGLWLASDELVQDSVGAYTAPVLSIHGSTPYCFWTSSPTDHHIYYKKRESGTWDVSPTDWIDESTDQITADDNLSAFYKSYNYYIGLAYLTKTSSPYQVKFNYLDFTPTITVSGNAYADEATTVWTGCDGTTARISLVVNGGTASTTFCNATTGAYSFTGVTVAANNPVSVFFNAVDKGVAVTVAADGTSAITLNPRKNRVWVKTEGAVANITNTNLDHCDSASPAQCANAPYSVTTGALTVEAGVKIVIETGKTFAPGGAVTTPAMEIVGTYTASSYTLTLNGTGTGTTCTADANTVMPLCISGGTFTYNTSTVAYTGATNATSIAATTYYNLNTGGAATTTTYTVDGNITVTNILTIVTSTGTNTFDASTHTITLAGSTTPFVINATETFTPSTSTVIYTGSAATNVTSTTYNNLNIGGSGTTATYTAAGDITANSVLTIVTSTGTNTFNASTYTITLAGSGTPFVISSSEIFTASSSTFIYTSGTGATVTSTTYNHLTINGTGTFNATVDTLTVNGNLQVTTGTFNLDTNDPTTTIAGNVTIADSASAVLTASNSGTFNVGGSWSVGALGTFTASGGTVIFNSSAGSETIVTGGTGAGKDFTSVAFNNAGGIWTISTNNLTATANFNLTSATAFDATSRTITVQGEFKNDVGGAATTWTGSSLILDGTGSYTINTTKNIGDDVYATLQVSSGQYIRMWDSSAATYTINGTLYSMDHAAVDGNLSIWGAYSVPASSTDYWSYATDFDNAAVTRQCQVTLQSGASVTVPSGSSLEIKGGTGVSGDKTTVTYQPAVGSWNLNNNTASELTFQEAKIDYMKVNAGTVTVLNTVLDGTGEPIAPTAGATLNVDWYLGGHLVHATALTDIQTDTSTDVIISENSGTPQSTIWKYSTGSWGSPAAQKETGTGSNGEIPQPGSDGAIRIREYSRASTGYTFYYYNLYVKWQASYGEYDYFNRAGREKYVTSYYNTSSHDYIIGDSGTNNWYRDDIDVNNTQPILDDPPIYGTFYCGLRLGLEFEIVDSDTETPPTLEIGTLGAPNYTNTDWVDLKVTTSASHGYIVTAWAVTLYTPDVFRHTLYSDTYYIQNFYGTYGTPQTWGATDYCKDNDLYCGFGYTSNDPLVDGSNLYAGGTKYVQFPYQSSGYRVSDYNQPVSATQTGGTYRVTVKASVKETQLSGDYSTTIVFICTAQY